MPHKRIQGARQYAVPGCCYQLPIVIIDDEKPAPTRTTTKTLTKTDTVMIGEQMRDMWQGRVDRPATHAEQPQRCRVSSISTSPNVRYSKANDLQKRARQYLDDDTEETDEGAKRLRLAGEDRFRGEGGLNHYKPQLTRQPFHQNNYTHFIKNSVDSSEPSLSDLEASLRTMQRGIDQRCTIARDIEMAEEQSRLQDEAEQAREADLRDRRFRSTVQSSLYTMWRDCDREREVAEELRQAREREQREQVQMKEREEEQMRRRELSNMEINLKGMWEAHDLEQGRTPKIRPGQLSEAGQRRVRERAEALRRRNQ